MSHNGAGTGVHSLKCIRERCYIDRVTGCWLWRGAMTMGRIPETHVAAGVLESKRASMSAPRAAWLLSGKTVEPGHSVYRAVCHDMRCCNPAHLAAGTSKDRALSASSHGQFRDSSRILRLHTHRRVTEPEVVQAVADDIAAGMTCKAAATRHGINVEVAKKIRRGDHVHQRAPLLNGASVFAWRP